MLSTILQMRLLALVQSWRMTQHLAKLQKELAQAQIAKTDAVIEREIDPEEVARVAEILTGGQPSRSAMDTLGPMLKHKP